MDLNTQDETPADVTILGAGIIGICSALAMQERGLSIAIIDRQEPGEATSYGNAGIVSPWSIVPQSMPGVWKSVPKWLLDPEGPLRLRWREIPGLLPWFAQFLANTRAHRVHEISGAMDMLMRGNIEAYRYFLRGTGRESLLQDSWLINVFRGSGRPNLQDLGWRLRIERGGPIEMVDGDELREIEPEIATDFEFGVIQKDQSRALSPDEICKVLADKARRQGAEFVRCEVKQLVRAGDGHISLETDIGQIQTKKLALCGGVWSADLLKPLGIKLPLASERGYHLEFSDPGVELNHSILDVSGKFIMSSMLGGVRSAGTSEFAHVDAPPNYRRADILAPMSKRLIPNLRTERVRRWVGSRPSFPDNLPVIGNVPNLPHLYLAFGHSHYGLGMGPATGRLLSTIVAGETPNEDLTNVSLSRFS